MTGRKGRFISFEGIDGAGKSTHIAALAEHLRRRGARVLTTREPGGTELAEALRELVLARSMDALTEALLMFAARRDHLLSRIEPALAGGTTVLCDRFADASFAYQGAGRGVDRAVLESLEKWVQQGRQPDLTFWFDVPAREAARRRAGARAPDRFEQQDIAFFERVRSGYAERMQGSEGRIVLIEAEVAPAQVLEALKAELERRGW